MGYAAESATWRNAYLLGAQELRQGSPAARPALLDAEMVHAMPLGVVFDVLGTHVNGPRAWAHEITVGWSLSDTREQVTVTLRNGALTWVAGARAGSPTATVTLTRAAFEALVLGQLGLRETIATGAATVTGDGSAAATLFDVLDRFDAGFAIVEPRRPQ